MIMLLLQGADSLKKKLVMSTSHKRLNAVLKTGMLLSPALFFQVTPTRHKRTGLTLPGNMFSSFATLRSCDTLIQMSFISLRYYQVSMSSKWVKKHFVVCTLGLWTTFLPFLLFFAVGSRHIMAIFEKWIFRQQNVFPCCPTRWKIQFWGKCIYRISSIGYSVDTG